MSVETVDIEVHYTLHLQKDDFIKILKQAEVDGFDFNDAGKKETVRRYLQSDGINGVELTLEDPNAVKITNHLEK